MKIYLKIFIKLLLCFSSVVAMAQTNEIIINVSVDSELIKQFSTKELIIRIKNTTNRESTGEPTKLSVNNDRYTQVKLKPTDSLVYLTFEMSNNNGDGTYQNLADPEWGALFQAYLFKGGDSISIDIRKNGVLSFSGRGSEKLNCQYEINNIPYQAKGFKHRIIQFSNEGQLEQKLNFQDQTITNGIQMRMTILETYREKVPAAIYNLLRLDIKGFGEYEKFYHLHTNGYQFPDKKGKEILKKYYKNWISRDEIEKSDQTFMAKSAYYADMVFVREFAYFQIYHKSGSYQKGDSFKEVFDLLKNKYKGDFRDKLLYLSFERLNKFYSSEAKTFVDEALNIIKSPLYHRLLTDWKNRQYAVSQFELEDAQGKVHRLSDYKGKILVVDFWYTGCSSCVELNQSMHSMIKNYKHNSDVIFITISIDQQKDLWLKSVASGKYTSQTSVNLFTNGLGKNHPLIKNYNFTSFPRQLIIGQNGELITSSPPRPDSSSANALRFKNLLDGLLQDNSKIN